MYMEDLLGILNIFPFTWVYYMMFLRGLQYCPFINDWDRLHEQLLCVLRGSCSGVLLLDLSCWTASHLSTHAAAMAAVLTPHSGQVYCDSRTRIWYVTGTRMIPQEGQQH